MTASRRLLAALTCVALASSAGAAGTSESDCRAFHQECLDARAVGYRDAGICNVERLECPSEPADAPRELEKRRTPPDDRPRGDGKRSVVR